MSLAPDELMVLDGAPHPNDARASVAAVVFVRLTATQRLVSVWMTAGFSNEEIAQHLGITPQALAVVFDEISAMLSALRA